jgi:uncharacterized protein YerC
MFYKNQFQAHTPKFWHFKLANSLIVGNKYIITDYETFAGSGVETLVLTATSVDTFDVRVQSVDFPKDLLNYDIAGTDGVGTKGLIGYRKDTVNNLSTYYDFRTILFTRWETAPGSGIFTVLTDNGGASQQFLTFGAGCYNISIGKHFENNNIIFGDNNHSMTFGNYNNSMTFGNGNNLMIFGNGNSSMTFGEENNSMTFGNGNYSMTFGNENSSMTFGEYNNSMTFGNGNSSMTFGGYNNSMTFENNNYSMTFGGYNNSMTFGNGNYSMIFGNNNSSMTFGEENNSMTFGNGNYSMTFGGYNNSMTFGNSNSSINFGDNMLKINLGNSFNGSGLTFGANSITLLENAAHEKFIYKDATTSFRIRYYNNDALVFLDATS